MSIVNTEAHSLREYESGKTKALEGQRLAVITYRNRTGADQAGEYRKSKAVSLPRIEDAEIATQLTLLIPAIRSYLESVQDKIVRERDLAGASLVTADEVSIAGILSYLADSDTEGNRLTKDAAKAWFTTAIADTLTLTIAERMGITDLDAISDTDVKRIEKAVEMFADKVSSLAGGKTTYPKEVAESLRKAVCIAPEGDALRTRFVARLDKMIAAPAAQDLMDLL